ncbi:MAG TPA: hypothetical protein PLD23_06550 [Armatimonadota bacterium]|nr:hypothetical protein [Armatimonadota bacterium]HQK93145.1 hypothetical protein [Armatimonadota bacterium]
MDTYAPIAGTILIGFVCGVLGLVWTLRVLRDWRVTCRRPDGRRVVTGAGLGLAVSAVLAALVAQILQFDPLIGGASWVCVLTVAIMAVAGLLADSAHPAVRPGVVAPLRGRGRGTGTTGALKSLGALAAALLGARLLAPASTTELVVNAALILVWAHLLDSVATGPGRALKVYWVCWFALLLFVSPAASLRTIPLAIASMLIGPYDLSGRARVGSAGALALGASLGLSACTGIASLGARVLLVAGGLCVSVYLAWRPLRAVTREHPALAVIDAWGTPSAATPEAEDE